MSELQDKFKDIVSNIESRIKDEDELNFIKEQIANISVLFLDQLDKVVDLTTNKMDEIAENQRKLSEKITNIEKDIYMDDSYDFEIVCPYCNHEFISDFSSEIKKEVECPECHNVIELDWNEEEEHSCGGHCCSCDSGCECDDDDDKEENNEDDDM